MAQVATNTFEFCLPDTWHVTNLGPPAEMTGPAGERVMVSSAVISGNGSPEQHENVKLTAQKNAMTTMRMGARTRHLQSMSPLIVDKTSEGHWFSETHSRTFDGKKYFSQFAVAGPRTIVLATVEGFIESESTVSLIRFAVMGINWI